MAETHRSSDTNAFVTFLKQLTGSPDPSLRDLFDPANPVTIARAPGRLDVMGGIADYSGSLVLQLPLAEATFAAIQLTESPEITVVTTGDLPGRSRSATLSLEDLGLSGNPLGYPEASEFFSKDSATHWAAYIAGAFTVLALEKGSGFTQGAKILIDSDVPEGKGVSSSAALEVASMNAIAAAYEIDLSAKELALLCQKVENLVVGAPCGVMDQMTSVFGETGTLMALLCQPAELQGGVALPEALTVWGLDSGIRHSVSGADYGSVRVGAFMGYRIIAESAGLSARAEGNGVTVDDPDWHGYLANVTPSVFQSRFAEILPERISGAEFLQKYKGTTDLVTTVDPNSEYAVRAPAAHPVNEHSRVKTFAALLGSIENEERSQLLGELMYQSHASYSSCGLGSDGTDRLVDLVREIGPAKGLYGAKITGGGSGGTVAVLGRTNATEAIQAVASRYQAETGHDPHIFTGSSMGANVCGTEVISLR
jgi:galactokinase